jgi:hypothetical protein
MNDSFPLDNDVWLKGTLVVHAVGRRDRKPQAGRRVVVKACGLG